MLWTSSKYAERRLEAAVEAMDKNIEDKSFFLLENYYNSLVFKGFSRNYIKSQASRQPLFIVPEHTPNPVYIMLRF